VHVRVWLSGLCSGIIVLSSISPSFPVELRAWLHIVNEKKGNGKGRTRSEETDALAHRRFEVEGDEEVDACAVWVISPAAPTHK
jgi:hypothetical protein